MKGFCDEFGWFKYGLVVVIISLILTQLYIYGTVNIEFTGSREIAKLKEWNVECNRLLDVKCDPCPEVQCAGDMTLAGFLIGMFFGFVGGIWFSLNFGKKFAEVFKKELGKVKK